MTKPIVPSPQSATVLPSVPPPPPPPPLTPTRGDLQVPTQFPPDSSSQFPSDTSPQLPPDHTPVADLIAAITAGQIDPTTLAVDLRRQCTGYLTGQGFAVAEIASVLRTGERTIQRDRAALRADSAMHPSIQLGDELMGELHQSVLASCQRLTRLACSADAPPYVKVWAEATMLRQWTTLIDKARDLGYFTTATARLNELIDDDPDTRRRAKRRQREADLSQAHFMLCTQPNRVDRLIDRIREKRKLRQRTKHGEHRSSSGQRNQTRDPAPAPQRPPAKPPSPKPASSKPASSKPEAWQLLEQAMMVPPDDNKTALALIASALAAHQRTG